MLNSTIQIKIKERLNKLDSQDYDNLDCWQIVEAFNKAQLTWPRRQLVGTNALKQGDEQSKRRIDDLQKLLVVNDLQLTTRPTFLESDTLPIDYMEFKRIDLNVTSDCCNNEIPMVAYLVEEANIPILLRDFTKRPSLEWGETLMTFMDNKIRVYTNGEFTASKIGLYYYRKPIPIQVINCVDIYTGLISTTEVACEFKDDVVEVLIDEAVSILAGDMESMNQFQRAQQDTEKNN